VSPDRVIHAPITIDLPAKALKVAVGDTTKYALLEDGTVVSWGTNDEGQLGNGPMGATELGRYPKPVPVKGITNVAAVHLGGNRPFAVRTDGSPWAGDEGRRRATDGRRGLTPKFT